MDSLRSVLVGVDFSGCSRSALSQAVRIASWNGATLHVLHVINSMLLTEVLAVMSRPEEDVRREVEGQVLQMIEEVSAPGERPPGMQVEVRLGAPIAEVLAKVREVAADLLILGVHGAYGAADGVGPLAAKCVRKAPTKVMLVPEPQTGPFTNVVACVDFSDTSRVAVEQAVRVAVRDRARLHLLHVLSNPWERLFLTPSNRDATQEWERQHRRMLQSSLEEYAQQFAAQTRGLEVRCQILDHRSYGEGINEYIGTQKADLVVLGTRGKTNLRYVLLGSTAERVVRKCRCAVLAIKPPGFTFEVPA